MGGERPFKRFFINQPDGDITSESPHPVVSEGIRLTVPKGSNNIVELVLVCNVSVVKSWTALIDAVQTRPKFNPTPVWA